MKTKGRLESCQEALHVFSRCALSTRWILIDLRVTIFKIWTTLINPLILWMHNSNCLLFLFIMKTWKICMQVLSNQKKKGKLWNNYCQCSSFEVIKVSVFQFLWINKLVSVNWKRQLTPRFTQTRTSSFLPSANDWHLLNELDLSLFSKAKILHWILQLNVKIRWFFIF